jgi:hypothetical protein
VIEPAGNGDANVLDPVQAGQPEISGERWASRLVVFLRLTAALALAKGLYHWAVVCGVDAVTPTGFDAYPLAFQSATVFFAVIDLVAAVGLWLAAPWGAVVWLTSAISMAAVEALFPQIYGGRIWVIAVELMLLLAYLLLALLSAREQER